MSFILAFRSKNDNGKKYTYLAFLVFALEVYKSLFSTNHELITYVMNGLVSNF